MSLLKPRVIEEINIMLESYLRNIDLNKKIDLFSNFINKYQNLNEEKLIINFDDFLKSINYEYDIDEILVLLDNNSIL